MHDFSRHAYYYALKHEARSITARAISARSGGPFDKVSLASIDQAALDEARLEWPKFYSAETHEGFAYSWERLHHKFFSRPSYFDLAVWQIVNGRRVLQGLALGRPSNARTRLALNWVERSFAPTYLRGGLLIPVLTCAEEYAKLLGSEIVVIRDAVDPILYERYGYSPHRLKAVGEVLVKELTYGKA